MSDMSVQTAGGEPDDGKFLSEEFGVGGPPASLEEGQPPARTVGAVAFENASKEGNNRIHWAIGKISGVQVALCETNYNTNQTDGRKAFNMNHWGNYNRGGWKGCDLRYDILGSTNKAPSGYGSSPAAGRTGYDPSNYDIVNSPVANTLAAAFPKDVRRVLKTVTKYTDNVGNASGDTAGNVTASVDYFFLFAEKEVYGGSRSYANCQRQPENVDFRRNGM